jgi:hypothetical protein
VSVCQTSPGTDSRKARYGGETLEEISWSLPLRRCFNATVKVAVDCAPLFVTNSEQMQAPLADQRIAGTVLVLHCRPAPILQGVAPPVVLSCRIVS